MFSATFSPRSVFLRIAICRALAKEVPEKYSSGDFDKVAFDFTGFTIFEKSRPEERYLLINRLRRNIFTGIVSFEDFGANNACINLTAFSDPDFEIIRVYGPIRLQFNIPLRYLLSEITGKHWFQFRSEKGAISRFRRKFVFRAERYSVLKLILNELEGKSKFGERLDENWRFSPISIFEEIYTNRIWYHNEQRKFLARFLFVIDSFVESGEAKRDGSAYILLPKALVTIAEEERKISFERDERKRSVWMIVLTAVVAFSSIGQVISTFALR